MERNWNNLLVPEGVNKMDIAALAPHAPAPFPPVVVKPEEFELKKLKIVKAASEETVFFTAEIFRNGKRVGYARNDGHGGSTILHAAEGTRNEFKELEAWAEALPPVGAYSWIHSDLLCGRRFDQTLDQIDADFHTATWNMDLEHLVDLVVNREELRKSIRGLGKHVLAGPCGGRQGAVMLAFSGAGAVTSRDLDGVRKDHGWACLYTEVFALPTHYYPAPHQFTGYRWPNQVVESEWGRAEVQADTNDALVSLRFSDGSIRRAAPDSLVLLPKGAKLTPEEAVGA